MLAAIDLLLFGLPLLFSAVSLFALHWFPWHGGARPLSRTDAYTIGTLIVVGLPVLTMLLGALLGQLRGQVFWAVLLLANMAVSGATVHLAYWIDSRRALTLEDRHATGRNQL